MTTSQAPVTNLQSKLFPFLNELEDNWKTVLEELDSILYNEVEANKSYFTPWHETDIYSGSWDVYGLYSFGDKLESNCKYCPRTTELIEAIPGMVTAGFSALGPETHIKPHVGYTNQVLRCHLGLVGPEITTIDKSGNYWLRTGIDPEDKLPTCGMRVDDSIFQWNPGKAFVFDDTKEHEAWNFGNRTRFILLIDFKKDSFPILNV